MPLDANSCARFNLRTRARILLEAEVHGEVVEGNGGSGKMSRQREAASSGPVEAATATAAVPCALSHIPFKFEPWHRSVLAHEEDVKAALLT